MNEIKQKTMEYNVELKIDDIDYAIRKSIIDIAMLLMFDEQGVYLPAQKNIYYLLSLIHNCFKITDRTGSEIDIFKSNLSNDELYEIAYFYDYERDLPYRKLRDIKNDIDESIRYRLLNLEMKANRTSKYDDVLDSILEFISKYKNVFNNIDINKYVKDISMLSKKIGDIKEEDVVKNIVKLMHDNPIEKININENDSVTVEDDDKK